MILDNINCNRGHSNIFYTWKIFGVIYELLCEITCLRRFSNNKGADQPAHSRSLISAFIIPILKSIISNLLQVQFHYFSMSL